MLEQTTDGGDDWFSNNTPTLDSLGYKIVGSTTDYRTLYKDPATGKFYTRTPGPQGTYSLYDGEYYLTGYGPGSTPSQTPAPPPAGATGLAALWESSGHDPQRFTQAYIAQNHLVGKQSDPATVKKIVDALNVVWPGHAVQDSRTDGLSKGFTVDGKFIKVLDGSDNWIWDASGGVGEKTGVLGDPKTIGSLLEPFPGYFASANGTAPTLEQSEFSYPEFQMPTGDEVLKSDPGYIFRAEQGGKALLQNRAMQGILSSGGTAKEFDDYNQNAASQEFANFFDRKMSAYKTNFGTAKDVSAIGNDRRTALYNAQYKNYLDQYNMFRQRQQDTNQYLTGQQEIGIKANA